MANKKEISNVVYAAEVLEILALCLRVIDARAEAKRGQGRNECA